MQTTSYQVANATQTHNPLNGHGHVLQPSSGTTLFYNA